MKKKRTTYNNPFNIDVDVIIVDDTEDNKYISYRKILKITCDYYSISMYDLFKKTRKRKIVTARQIFFCLCEKYTKLKISELSRLALDYKRKAAFNHATILHAFKVMKNLYDVDLDINSQIKDLNKLILSNYKSPYVVNNIDLLAITKTF